MLRYSGMASLLFEPQGSLPCFQESAISANPDSDKRSPHILVHWSIFQYYPNFWTGVVNIFFIFGIHATSTAHIIPLHFIALIIFDVGQEL